MSGLVVIERTNTILYCTLWRRTVEFYGETLGFDVTFENDWFVEFALGGNSHLSVANADRATVDAPDGSGITLSWQVPDIDDAHRMLSERGAEPGKIHQRWGAAAFQLHDPEGHRIEFWAER